MTWKIEAKRLPIPDFPVLGEIFGHLYIEVWDGSNTRYAQYNGLATHPDTGEPTPAGPDGFDIKIFDDRTVAPEGNSRSSNTHDGVLLFEGTEVQVKAALDYADSAANYLNNQDYRYMTIPHQTFTDEDGNTVPFFNSNAVFNSIVLAMQQAVPISQASIDAAKDLGLINPGSDLSMYHGVNWSPNTDDLQGTDILVTGGREAITGSEYFDKIKGSSTGETLKGSGGGDYIDASGGHDKIYGGIGADTLIGDSGNDSLYGESGADTFWFSMIDGEDTIYGGDATDRIGIFYNNNTVANNLELGLSGLTPFDLVGTAAESEIANWQYEMSYGGGYKSLFNWGGDPTVEGSTGTLAIDFDNSGYYDIVIENFASGDFGIHIEGAEEEDEGSGGIDPHPFSNPGVNSNGINWGSGGLGLGEDLVALVVEPRADEPIDVGGGIVINAGEQEYGAEISGIGISGDVAGGSHGLVALPDLSGNGWPEANIGAGVLGDPHVVSFDGLFYDFQDTGEFTLIQSTNENPFTVQARMREWDLGDAVGDKFSVNTAIATELNGVKVGFYIKGSLPYDLAAAAADSDPYNDEQPVLYVGDYGYLLPDQGIMLVEDGFIYRNGNDYTVRNATGDTITVTMHDTHIDFRTSSPDSRMNNVEGMLGNFDGDTTNDFKLDNGTDLGSSISTNTLYDVFGEDWRITQGESLFLYGVGENTSSFNNPDFDNVQRTLADFDAALVAAAESAAIAEGFDPNSAVFEAAVLDFLVMGFVEYDEAWQQLEQQTVVQADINNPSDIVMGTTGNDSIIGTPDKDYMMALEGDDTIYGRGDNDTIVGGAGNDIIYGEGGADTYIHNQGDGNDTISSGEYLSFDVITMNDAEGNKLTADNLFFNVNGYNLLVTNLLSGETLTLKDMYYSTGKTFAFVNDIDVRAALPIKGSDSDDVIHGTGYSDTLEGGLGNDTIYGKTGADTYIHNQGDGSDTIYGGEANSSDIIIMHDDNGVELAQEDIEFVKSGWDLLVTNRNTDESITIINQFAFTGKFIASVNGINVQGGLNFLGTDAAESIYGTGYGDTLEGGLGDDVLTGYGGLDTYVHNQGDGNDTINGGEANSSDALILRDDNGVELAQEDLLYTRNSLDLVVTNRTSGESVTITNQFAFTGKFIATVNGVNVQSGINFVGTDAGDDITGTSYGDTLIGGLSNDTLRGSNGADLYIHNEGDGSDILYSGEVLSSDVISMRDSNNVEIAEADLMFSQMGYDLVVTNINNSETLVLKSMYYSTGHTFDYLNGIDLDTVL